MLVLTRKVGQALFIDGHEVVVRNVRGNRVSLGVVAPRHVAVRRGELTDGQQDANGATEGPQGGDE